MKTIAFFVRNLHPDKAPFQNREYYYYSYQEYLLGMKRAGANAYFVTNNDTYAGKGHFTQAWAIDKVSDVSDFTPAGEIQADIVFDKGGFEGRDITTVTDPLLAPLLNNKAATYQAFGKYQPKTIICNDKPALSRAIEALAKTEDMIVVKAAQGTGGKRVYIGTKSEIKVPDDETYPLLVQEFVDMSDGVPGLANAGHDVRIIFAGSTIVGASLRQPAQGKFHANISQGGTERLLSDAEIPPEVRALALEIDGQLEDLPRYYSIDFAKGKHGWVLIELNDKPGLFREAVYGPMTRVLIDKFSHYLVSL